MVKRVAFLFAVAFTAPAHADCVDLANWAAGLPAHFAVHGVKVEPTWEETIDIRRDGDLFEVTGGAPAWEARTTEAVALNAAGNLIKISCDAAPCRIASPPAGFLATAALVSASARGQLRGTLATVPYGTRHVICVPGEMLGIRNPILDPCFDQESGAVLAERRRLTQRFDGPSLEPTSLRVD